MSRIRTGLWSIETRLGTVPTFDTGSPTPTGTLSAPAPSSTLSAVPGLGVGAVPTVNRDRIANAADRAMGMANVMHDAVADQLALKGLRDGLRAMRVSQATVSAQAMKAMFDITITNANRERRMNDALVTFWPGATVASISRDLVSGVYYAGSHEAGYVPPTAPSGGQIAADAWKFSIKTPTTSSGGCIPGRSVMEGGCVTAFTPTGGGMTDSGNTSRSPGSTPTPTDRTDPLLRNALDTGGRTPSFDAGVLVPGGSGVDTVSPPPASSGFRLSEMQKGGLALLAGLAVGVVAISASR